jgi:hypothetical protein
MTTPNEVVAGLAQLARDLDATVRQLQDADREATIKRHDADLAMSKTFLTAQGSVEHRKHLAAVECEHVERDALLAEAVVRHLRRRIDATKVRVDVGRSMNSALRAEAGMS